MANPIVAENAGPVVIEVMLMGQIDRNISVTVETSAGTASGKMIVFIKLPLVARIKSRDLAAQSGNVM